MKNSFGFIDAKRLGLAILMAIMLATMITMPAEAIPMYKLDVNYTDGSIISGPLSFGLSTLPTSVTATFMLGPGQPSSTDPGDIIFDDEDVDSASVTFGDATWTGSDLVGFDMLFDGSVSSLIYSFSPINTLTAQGPIVINFPLKITGTDKASDDAFEYEYLNSTQTLAPVPEPSTMLLLGTGLIGLVGWSRKKFKINN